MRTENQRIKSRKVSLSPENIGTTQVVARPVDAMVHAGGTAPDTSMGDTGKILGDIPALFGQYGQLQASQMESNKKQGMMDQMNGQAPKAPSNFMNVGRGYDEGYYAAKDEQQGLLFNSAIKNALKEVDHFSDIDDPATLETKMEELYQNTYSKFFPQEYMGSRKELTYEGASRVVQGRTEAFIETTNRHSDKRAQTVLSGAYTRISDYIDGVQTQKLPTDDAIKAIKSQIDIGYEDAQTHGISRDRYDSMMVERLGREASERAMNGDETAVDLIDMMYGLYEGIHVQGEDGNVKSRFGGALDTYKNQVFDAIATHDKAKETKRKVVREENQSYYLSKLETLDTRDPTALVSLRAEIVAKGEKNEIEGYKSLLESLHTVEDNANFATDDDGVVFKAAYTQAMLGKLSNDEINTLSDKLTRSSWLKIFTKNNESQRSNRAEARANKEGSGGGGLGNKEDHRRYMERKNRYLREGMNSSMWTDSAGIDKDPNNNVRRNTAMYHFDILNEEFIAENKRYPSTREMRTLQSEAIDMAWDDVPSLDGTRTMQPKASQAQPKATPQAQPQGQTPVTKPTLKAGTPQGSKPLPKAKPAQNGGLKAPPPLSKQAQTINALRGLQ